MAVVKEGLLYTKSHEWVEIDGELARVGITDFAQEHLGDVVYVETKPAGDRISAGEAIGTIESVKVASDIYSPLSGEIVSVNETLGNAPERMNSDPYACWLVTLRLANSAETAGLMDPAGYADYCRDTI
jgi:glycine cleavage system H protein